MRELLISAKNGDNNAKEKIIDMYYPLIIKEAKNIFIKGKSFEDLIQIGILHLLNAINKFDIDRDYKSFPSYASWSIKNGFRYLCRSEIRYNDELSLNKPNDDGLELEESIIDDKTNVETTVLQDIIYENLYLALEKLDNEEKELIEFLFIKNERPNLTKYCKEYNKDYYYASCLKKRALKKLNNFLINILQWNPSLLSFLLIVFNYIDLV